MVGRMRLACVAASCILALSSGAGCVRALPWQRGDLARWSMEHRFGEDPLSAQYRSKVLETLAGGGLPGEAPGGGCGCSQ